MPTTHDTIIKRIIPTIRMVAALLLRIIFPQLIATVLLLRMLQIPHVAIAIPLVTKLLVL